MKTFTVAYFSFIRAGVGSIFLFVGSVLFLYLALTDTSLFIERDETSLILIDQSLSMTVEDISSSSTTKIQSRLDTAKEMIHAQFKGPKNVGVISFAKNPTLLIPISQIQSDFVRLIEGIPPVSEAGGSDLPLALQFAKNLYGDTALTVSIFSDGGDTSLSELPKIPQNWRITIYGLGSNAGGKIPLGYNALGERRYKYFSGSEIVLPYESEKIESVAKKIGAHIIRIDTTKSGKSDIPLRIFLDNIYYTLSALFLLLGILIHPYGRK